MQHIWFNWHHILFDCANIDWLVDLDDLWNNLLISLKWQKKHFAAQTLDTSFVKFEERCESQFLSTELNFYVQENLLVDLCGENTNLRNLTSDLSKVKHKLSALDLLPPSCEFPDVIHLILQDATDQTCCDQCSRCCDPTPGADRSVSIPTSRLQQLLTVPTLRQHGSGTQQDYSEV